MKKPEATSKKRIFRALLVEDNPTFRQVVKDLLDYRFPAIIVDEAANGKAAMEAIERHRPDLIFMDIKLPGENGLKLTQRIFLQHPDIHIFILTSYDLPEYRQAALQYGARSFITKGSSTIEEIADLVEKFIKTAETPAPRKSEN